MPRLFLSLVFLCGFLYAMGQTLERYDPKVVIYPLNLPYVFFDRYDSYIEIPISSNFGLVAGSHIIRGPYNFYQFSDSKGQGFEIQFKQNFNRDTNLIFRYNGYWAFIAEFDKVRSESSYSELSTRRFGILSGVYWDKAGGLRINLFYGAGYQKITNSEISYGFLYSNGEPYIKGGVLFGLRL